MSHRADDKAARRAQRLALEAQQRRDRQRERLMRRAGYGVVVVIGAALVTLAVALGGGDGTTSAGGTAATRGNAAARGALAPAFSLTDVVSGRQVTAASLRGARTMLFFSEGVSCQACMVQIADLQKDGTLRRAGINLVGVTTDQPGDLAQAAAQYGIRTPLLADPTTRMSAAYGMLGHGGMQHATQDGHAFVLLGADGRVLWHQAYVQMYVEPSRLIGDMRAAMRA